MKRLYCVEELVINDSFISYCFQTNEEDIAFWERYIFLHPLEVEKINEARDLVWGLHEAVKEADAPFYNSAGDAAGLHSTGPNQHNSIKRIIFWVSGAAAVVLIFLVLNIFEKGRLSRVGDDAQKIATTITNTDTGLVYTTGNGEKKIVRLPDQSLLHLNSGSTLRIEKNFGRDNRVVFLSGEALFDVTHDEKLPFVVTTSDYKVTVLGTLFNVKAYPKDNSSETSLIRGRVVVDLKNKSERVVLKPDQKIVVTNNSLRAAEPKDSLTDGATAPAAVASVVMPLSHSESDNIVIETAWAQNRLEIVNERFGNIKDELERWFDVKITFKDAAVEKYRFTATFEKENIEDVLNALRLAYPFGFAINGNEITITK